jgi:hypothetical protein
MKFDNPLTPRARTLSPISILETCIDVYKRLFTNVDIRLVNVYSRFEKDMLIEIQAVVIIMAIVAARELRI